MNLATLRKTVLAVVLVFLSSGCVRRGIAPLTNPNAIIARMDTLEKFAVEFENRGYEDANDIKRAEDALLLLEKVVNSPRFREEVLRFQFNTGGRNGTLGFSNDELLAIILSGGELETLAAAESDEDISKVATGVLKLRLSLDKVSPREIGHTNMETNDIVTGLKWFRTNNLCEIAGHYLHEYSHTVGFIHTYRDVYNRPHSVPYGLGNIGVTIAQELTRGTCELASSSEP